MNIHDLEICKKYKFIRGEGPKNANVMLVGQNPGKKEDETGKPFVGRSGKYLDEVLRKNSIDRKKLYITSIVKCRTPGNRKPTEGEINASIPYLVRQIRVVNPKIIVLMGKTAWNTPKLEGIDYIKTYHPAAAMRFPKVRKKFEADFMKLRGKL